MKHVGYPHGARFSKGDRNKLRRFNKKAIIKRCNCRIPKEGTLPSRRGVLSTEAGPEWVLAGTRRPGSRGRPSGWG